MPRHPDLSSTVAALRASPFTKLAHRIGGLDGEVYPLHVGDTWLEPMSGARMQDLRVEDHRGLHRYAPPHGHPDLLDAICERRGVTSERVLVSAGATGGLAAVAGATLAPGDEVLLLAPYWPLISGVVRVAHGDELARPSVLTARTG